MTKGSSFRKTNQLSEAQAGEEERGGELGFRGSEFTAAGVVARTTAKDAHAGAPTASLRPKSGCASKPAEFLAVTNYS